jgi:hypothetical protein
MIFHPKTFQKKPLSLLKNSENELFWFPYQLEIRSNDAHFFALEAARFALTSCYVLPAFARDVVLRPPSQQAAATLTLSLTISGA